jgi:tripartite-type tricarboxylate transporter receptor subunit TctC
MSRVFALLLALAMAPSVFAQTYPARPVKIIVPFAAGSGADSIIRKLGTKLSEQMSQTFVVENREGANGTIGIAAAAKAPADGYTLVYASNSTLAAAPLMYKKLPYAPSDLVSISRTGNFPSVFLVQDAFPAKTLDELVTMAKDKPGEIFYGYAQATAFAGGESLKAARNLKMEGIAYKTGATAMTDLLSGRLQVYVCDFVTAYPQLKAGKVRGLAATSSSRIPAWPSTPTLGESIPGSVDIFGWGVLSAPKGTPQSVVDTLNANVNKALADPEIQEFYRSIGAELVLSSPRESQAFVESEMRKWEKVLLAAGVKPE